MSKPILLAETPNAGSLGTRFLASQDQVAQGQASAFVGRGRSASEATGDNYLAVRRMVPRLAGGKDAPSVLVLVGIDAKGLEPERRAALLKKLHGFLPEVEYAAGQVDWTTEKRRVVPSSELAALIDNDLSSLPPADTSRPRDGQSSGAGLWIALGAIVLIAGAGAALFAFSTKKPEKEKRVIREPEKKPASDGPADAVRNLKNRLALTSDPTRLEKLAQEADKLRGDPAYKDHVAALESVAREANSQRQAILKKEAQQREEERLARVEHGKKTWPGTETKVRELALDEKYSAAAFRLGKKNEAFPEQWERLRGWLANEVILHLKARAKELTDENKFDEARSAIRGMTRPEIVAVDAEIATTGKRTLATLDAREDRYRWEDILEAQEARREEKVKAYLRSAVPGKRGQKQAAQLLRWFQGDWPRPAMLAVVAEPGTAVDGLAIEGKPVAALPARVAVVLKPGEALKVQTAKGIESVPLEQLPGGATVLGVRVSVAKLGLPKYDALPAIPASTASRTGP